MAEAPRNPWTVRATRRVYENPWIAVDEHDVLNPSGNPTIYGVVRLKNLAVGVLPIDADGSTYLVGQHRFPRDYYSWELPEGGGAMDRPAVESAARELREETGLAATSWLEFLRMDLSNAVTDEQAVAFLAWDLTQHAPEPDDDELIRIRRLPVGEAVEMAMAGEIVDAFSIAMLLKARAMAARGLLPAAVARHLA